MAEASISVDHDQFICAVCLDLLKDPVTLHCGHSFCKVCINDCWDQEDQKGIYSCPQCRDTFTPRPVLRRSNMLAEVVEKLKKKTDVQAASPAHCYAGPGDVECDFCTGRKHKAVKSCLTCLASFCETHLKPHYIVSSWTNHTLIEASKQLQEKICSEHDDVLKIYCRTDQICICSMCMLDKHKGHDAVAVAAERAERWRLTELEQLSHTHNHSISVHQHLSFDAVRNSLSDLKERLEEFCEEEFNKIPPHVKGIRVAFKSRDKLLKYFCYLTLDPNTAQQELILSEKNRAVRCSGREQQYSDHPERFDYLWQVLCKESLCGHCYWEVEWSAGVYISVSYKGIKRKGRGDESRFGCNNRSWSLRCSSSFSSSLSFYHNNVKTDLRAPSSSRIGVYVDHSAGTLSFYSVSDTMKLLHRVHTTFTQPLYAGFRLCFPSNVRLCDSK